MNLVFVAAFVAACSAAKLDRTYLPPASSQFAGGTPAIYDSHFSSNGFNSLTPGLQTPFERTGDSNPSPGNQAPSGSYENEHQGVVVDAAAPGTRASNQPSGIGGPRISYGSTDSKVGDAAFRGTKNKPAANSGADGSFAAFQSQTQFGSYQPQRPVNIIGPDLSGFYQPTGQKPTSFLRPNIQIFRDRVPATVKYHNNMGLNKFNYGFETENGIIMMENGVSNKGAMTQGGYSYKGDDGKVYSLVYTADKGGFQPTGTHLPTPPPIPAEIMESLQQNAKDEANGIYDDGSYDAQKYNAEDDYAQSDANDNDNDRQSNKFGERPGNAAGASTFINQDQQGFVRPNFQGQFSLNGFSNTKDSSTRPDTSIFGTGVSTFDNKKQSHKFGDQLGFTGASAFINQGQQGFVRPNVQGQFNSYGFSNSKGSTQPDTSKFGTGATGFDNTKQFNRFGERSGTQAVGNTFINKGQQSFGKPNVQRPFTSYDFSKDSPTALIDTQFETGANAFDKSLNKENNNQTTGQNNQVNNEFGSQFQYLPPLGDVQDSLSEQKIQGQSLFEKPYTTLIKPNSFGASNSGSGSGSLNNQQTQSSQSLNSFSTDNSPQNSYANFQTGIQSSLDSDLGLEINSNAQNSTVVYGNGSLALPTPILNIAITSAQQNVNNKNQETSFQTGLQSSGDSKDKNTNLHLSNKFSSSVLSPAFPTKQPELFLTTPLENQKLQATNIASSEHGQSFLNLQPQKPNSINLGNTQPLTNNQKQITDGELNNAFSGQPQGPDDSYIYNKPLKPFNTPSTQPDSNRFPGTSQFNSATINVTQPTGSLFPNAPESSIFSTQYQGLVGSTKYPQPPTLAPITTTLPTFEEDETKKNAFQTNGITQASISSFPLIPTSSSQTHSGEVYEYTKPAQGLPTSSQENITPEPNAETYQQNSLTSSLNGDPIKTQTNVQSNTQFGQRFPTPSTPSFGQQITPSRFGVQTGSFFGQKPIAQQQIGAQGTSSFEQKPTLSPDFNNAQSSSSFGEKITQQQLGSQTSFSFGQKITPSRFDALTSTSLNQQTTPTRFGVQTGSTFGQRPILSPFGAQTSTSYYNQQKTPSPFGIQSSSSFGKPSHFGVQTSSTFGQKPTQSQLARQTSFSFGQKPTQQQPSGQNSFSFGSQTTPPHFGAQTSTSFNRQTIPQPFGIQSSTSFGKPSQFGVQTSSTFGQKPTQSQSAGQTSFSFGQKPTQQQSSGQNIFSFGSQITPSRFGAQTSTSFNQQTTPSPFGIPSRFGVQSSSTFRQKPSQTQIGGQTSFSFTSQTTPSRFGAPISTSFGQQTTPSRFGIQTISTTGKQTTPSPFSVQTGSSFGDKTTPSRLNIQTGLSSGQHIPSRFDDQTILSAGQQTTPSPFSVQSSSTFGQKITPSQVADSLSEQQSTAQFGNKQQQNEYFAEPEQQTTSQESNEQSQIHSDSKPSTVQLITSISQNSQQSIDNGQIYQYNKPTTSFSPNEGNSALSPFYLQQSQANNQLSTGLNKENGQILGQQFAVQSDKLFGDNQQLQFNTKPNNPLGQPTEVTSSENKFTLNQQSQGGAQFDEQPTTTQTKEESFSTPTRNEGTGQQNQQSQVLSQSFADQQKVTQSVAPTSSSEQSFDNIESTSSSFSATNPDNTQISSQDSQGTFDLQKQDQPQNSQSGEVYQYDKPSQSLSESPEKVNNRFDQNTHQTQLTGQPGQNKVDSTKPITSHLSQNNKKFDNFQLPTQSPESPSKNDNRLQSASTQGTLPSSKPLDSRPQLSFHSACCGGFKTQNGQGSFSGKAPSDTSLNANFGSSSFGLNKNDDKVSDGSGLKDKFDNQDSGAGIRDFGVQKGSSSFNGKGEEFGGPRNPPKFDETGYHY